MPRAHLDGYVVSTDAPTCGCMLEPMELYPNTKVICTVQDPDAWAKSMTQVADAATMWFLRIVPFPISNMRYFVDYINELRKQFVYLYDEKEPLTRNIWDRHIK